MLTVDPLIVLRYAVLAVAGTLGVGALGAMAVQRRTISPFSRTARLIRRLTDPLLHPLEHRLLRSGGNPQSAPWWLLGAALVGGIVVVSLVEWLLRQLRRISFVAQSGPRGIAALLVSWGFGLLIAALVVRVIGSWLGAGRFTPWMRPFWWLTEWMLAPLRRVVPPFGPFDVTPIVAWLLLSVLRGLVLGFL